MRADTVIQTNSGDKSSHLLQSPMGRVCEDGESHFPESFYRIQAAISGRINVSPKRLLEPGPSRLQLEELLTLAAAAPDHGQILPWRFVLVPQEYRQRLGKAFVMALIERDPSATQEQIESARDKALRAPLLLVAIACYGKLETIIPDAERLVSLGAAIQNILIGACAMGFGSGLTSGQAMNAISIRECFHLRTDESAVCFINIGTVKSFKKNLRIRPQSASFFSVMS